MANHKNSNVDLLYDIEHDILTWQCFCILRIIGFFICFFKYMYHVTSIYNEKHEIRAIHCHLFI